MSKLGTCAQSLFGAIDNYSKYCCSFFFSSRSCSILVLRAVSAQEVFHLRRKQNGSWSRAFYFHAKRRRFLTHRHDGAVHAKEQVPLKRRAHAFSHRHWRAPRSTHRQSTQWQSLHFQSSTTALTTAMTTALTSARMHI